MNSFTSARYICLQRLHYNQVRTSSQGATRIKMNAVKVKEYDWRIKPTENLMLTLNIKTVYLQVKQEGGKEKKNHSFVCHSILAFTTETAIHQFCKHPSMTLLCHLKCAEGNYATTCHSFSFSPLRSRLTTKCRVTASCSIMQPDFCSRGDKKVSSQ